MLEARRVVIHRPITALQGCGTSTQVCSCATATFGKTHALSAYHLNLCTYASPSLIWCNELTELVQLGVCLKYPHDSLSGDFKSKLWHRADAQVWLLLRANLASTAVKMLTNTDMPLQSLAMMCMPQPHHVNSSMLVALHVLKLIECNFGSGLYVLIICTYTCQLVTLW